ncbi:transcriptional repressor [Gammaproteobacteria bacterium]|nr:transcriptional repressor [Gammaproteobacteria bacterium]
MNYCKIHKTCIDEAMKNAEIICNEKGIKLTKLRSRVLKLVWKSHNYVKAYDLLEDLKKIDSSAKPPTVYRSLDFLIENGFIHKIQSLNAFVGCTHPLEHKECYFLICNSCQNIEECCSVKLNKVVTSTTKKNHFKPDKVTLEIAGTCQECIN